MASDFVVALETWVVPTVWPSAAVSMGFWGVDSNSFYEPKLKDESCPMRGYSNVAPFCGTGYRTNRFVSGVGAYAFMVDMTDKDRPYPTRTEVGLSLSGAVYGTRAGPANTLVPFVHRPHQSFALIASDVSALGLPNASSGIPSPVPPARVEWTSERWKQWRGGRPLDTSFLMHWWDGISQDMTCGAGYWTPPPNDGKQLQVGSGTVCFGGGNSTCDVRADACPFWKPAPSPDRRDPESLRCIWPTVIGGQMNIGDRSHPPATWQLGNTVLTSWWKPCPACVDDAACDLEECRRNVSTLVQRRTARPGLAPAPAKLAELRRADGGAFAFYECWATPYESFFRALPVCVPLCDGEEEVPWQGLADGGAWPGRTSGRLWYMAWSGSRVERPRCVGASEVLAAAAASGVMLPDGEGGTACAAGHDGGADALLGPGLVAASTTLSLHVPVLQLRATTRSALLASIAAEVAASVAAGSDLCVAVSCVSCPDESNTSVWSADPDLPVPGEGMGSPAVRLDLGVSFQPVCDGAAGAPSWLVDANRPQGAAGGGRAGAGPRRLRDFPGVFRGAGANTSWLATHPEAVQAERLWLERRWSAPRRSAVLQALTLSAIVPDQGSWQVLGRWLSWARPSHQPGGQLRPAPVSVRVRCFYGDLRVVSVGAGKTSADGRASLSMGNCHDGLPALGGSMGVVVLVWSAGVAVIVGLACRGLPAWGKAHQERLAAHRLGSDDRSAAGRHRAVMALLVMGSARVTRFVSLACLLTVLAQLGGWLLAACLSAVAIGVVAHSVACAAWFGAARAEVERRNHARSLARMLSLGDGTQLLLGPQSWHHDDEAQRGGAPSAARVAPALLRPTSPAGAGAAVMQSSFWQATLPAIVSGLGDVAAGVEVSRYLGGAPVARDGSGDPSDWLSGRSDGDTGAGGALSSRAGRGAHVFPGASGGAAAWDGALPPASGAPGAGAPLEGVRSPGQTHAANQSFAWPPDRPPPRRPSFQIGDPVLPVAAQQRAGSARDGAAGPAADGVPAAPADTTRVRRIARRDAAESGDPEQRVAADATGAAERRSRDTHALASSVAAPSGGMLEGAPAAAIPAHQPPDPARDTKADAAAAWVAWAGVASVSGARDQAATGPPLEASLEAQREAEATEAPVPRHRRPAAASCGAATASWLAVAADASALLAAVFVLVVLSDPVMAGEAMRGWAERWAGAQAGAARKAAAFFVAPEVLGWAALPAGFTVAASVLAALANLMARR